MTYTSTEQPELLPCPFCGGDAGDTYYQLGWFISCKHCSASTEVTNAKARAVEAWNRRTPASQAQRVPLSEEQISVLNMQAWKGGGNVTKNFAHLIEAAHGITQEKQG